MSLSWPTLPFVQLRPLQPHPQFQHIESLQGGDFAVSYSYQLSNTAPTSAPVLSLASLNQRQVTISPVPQQANNTISDPLNASTGVEKSDSDESEQNDNSSDSNGDSPTLSRQQPHKSRRPSRQAKKQALGAFFDIFNTIIQQDDYARDKWRAYSRKHRSK